MRKAILFGFEYNGQLPGISIDLYYVYSFLKKHGWKDNEISIFTDIEKDYTTDILKTSILEKIVNPDILSFIEDCKERGQYKLFNSHNYYNNFDSTFSNTDQLLIYYTGHSKGGDIILPNLSLISFQHFRNLITLNSKSIVCIMDCCEGGIELPWILDDNIYRLKDDIDIKTFVKPKIICISSSLEDEKSRATKNGSFFTRSLFRILENPKQSLSSILKQIKIKEYKQTSNISSSYPNLYYLPPFFYSLSNLSIKINPFYITILKESILEN